MRSALIVASFLVLASCGPCSAADTWEVLIPGDPAPAVRHLHRVTTDPLNIHVLIVDLTSPRVRIRAGLKNDNDKPDDGETVRSICQRYNAVAGINCDYFAAFADPWNDFRHIPQGHNMTDGLLILPPGRTSPIVPDRTAMAFPSDNSYAVVGIFMSPQQWWHNVVAGGPRIIRNGVVGWEVEPDIPDQTSRQPRTGAAVSADYKTLILATVDGRQPSSRGMTANELGYLLKEFGGHNGLSFDGGGSTTMVINGTTVNSPSDGTDRRIANCLMILDRARQSGAEVLFESNFDPPVYRRGALDGQDGWAGSGSVVLRGRANSRCGALRCQNAQRIVSNTPASGVQWFEYWMSFSAASTDAFVSAGTTHCAYKACIIRLVNGELQAYDTDQLGNPVWSTLASCQPNTWYRIDVRLDYYIKRYQVFVNGVLKLSGASFKDASAGSGLQCIRFEETSGAADFYVDDIYVGGAEPNYLRISPDTLTMVSGAQTRFRAVAGTPPITWSITDERLPNGAPASTGSIAQISSDGLVTANSAGSFVVEASDKIGRADRSQRIVALEPLSLSAMKANVDGVIASACGLIVSAVYDGFVYLQDPVQPCGIRVVTDAPVAEGDVVWVVGTLETVNAERVINSSWLEVLF